MKKQRYVIGFMLLFFSSGCAFVAPDVKLTGSQTLVETQIIGEYKEIEPDAWAVSTVKTAVAREKTGAAAGDEAVMNAMRMRELNEDSIRRYKNEEAAGEANSGFIVYRPVKKYESDKDIKRVILSVLEDENKARRMIFERSIILSGKEKPSDTEIAALAKKFADEERQRAEKTDWIQGNDGQWQRKK